MTEIGALLETLAIAFAGGVFGACFGGVAAFAMCGLAALLGVVVRLAGGDGTFDALVTWGPFLGPQAAFVGGVGAAAFAGRQGLLESGRDIVTPLAARGSVAVLLMGGLWGVIGQSVFVLVGRLGGAGPTPWFDSMALAVALATLAARVAHGRVLLGTPEPCRGHWGRLDPSPERLWLPWQSRPGQITVLALAVALPTAWLATALPPATGFVFALSALSLLLFLGGGHPPVTLHMALAAGAAASIWGGWVPALLAAVACGLLAELFARLLLIHGDTHVDPPAWAIATTSLLIAVVRLGVPPGGP